jgi:hypothetical protein
MACPSVAHTVGHTLLSKVTLLGVLTLLGQGGRVLGPYH